MDHYNRESFGPSLKGTIICGSTSGYEGGQGFDLEQTLALFDNVNREIIDNDLAPIPCIVNEGTLIGRTDLGLYREEVYTFAFSWSPRVPAPGKDVFHQTLMEYADRLGNKMVQTRMYVEFDGNTTVLIKKED